MTEGPTLPEAAQAQSEAQAQPEAQAHPVAPARTQPGSRAQHRIPHAQVYTPGAHPPKRAPDFGAGRSAIVLVASTSCAEGRAEDTAGPVAVAWLRGLGYDCPDPVIVADGEPVGRALDHYLAELPWDARPRIIVTSGGTGLNPDDATPQLTSARLDYEVPGIMHAIWEYGLKKLDYAVMSRGVAGVRDRTFVVNLPGSRGGVRDGVTVLDTLIHHVQAQIEDLRDHPDERRQAASGGNVSGSAVSHAFTSGSPAPTSAGPAPDSPGADAAAPGGTDSDPAGAVAGEVVHAGVTEAPLDSAAAEAAVVSSGTGASVVFNGIIRDHDSGRAGVTGLAYTAHPDAGAILARTAEAVAAAHPRARIFASHRVGRLALGESALVVAVASAHRAEAFAAASALVDAIKESVPIWKEQFYSDGGHDWPGLR
ncbi:molybdenum cofactor biosynthesis protein MoaE [Brevibacterium album]|uniref:molybdenum cofactor biosynthesis protein MoaE n=1 Tax=Brevibacterium album TaxID=417948 RepID=UPI0004265EBB|nr:molybdenum cofactor biosynthesis protein MoaE [Brevibacterium album]